MAGILITDLDSAFELPANNDVLLFVDVSENRTKQISTELFLSGTTASKASTIIVNPDNSKVTNYVHFGDLDSGSDSVNTSALLTFDATAGKLNSSYFVGDGSLLTNIPGQLIDAISAGTDNDPYYLMLRNTAVGQDSTNTAPDLTYNPGTLTLTSGFFAGDGSYLTGVLADSSAVATFALIADSADHAAFALLALNATNADSAAAATYALVADSADHAAFALLALNATNATNADSASNATFSIVGSRAESILLQSDSSTSTTTYPLLSGSTGTGPIVPFTDTNKLSYNASTGALSATLLVGDGSLITNLPLSGGGVLAQAVNVVPSVVDASHSILFTQSASGVDSVNTSTLLTYNPSTGALGATSFAGFGRDLVDVPAIQLQTFTNPTVGTQYILMKATQTGMDSVATDGSITFDAATNTLSATNFSGDGSNISNVAALSATNATNVGITAVSADATYYLHFGSSASGNDNVNVDLNLTYNPALNILNTGLSYTTDSAGLWNGSAPTTVDSAVSRFALLLKTLNGGVGA
jgi:hypothetical protein